MDTPRRTEPLALLGERIGERIRKTRRERGLTQEALAGPEFTKGYVSALERGAVRPSLKALELFARRLGVPVTDFLEARQEIDIEPELEALQEDVHYQSNYAKMLIRTGSADKALELIDEIEGSMLRYREKLPVSLLYLPPFLRGRAYIQLLRADLAQPELEKALEVAQTDEEATARVHNLLGVAYHHQEQPQLALQHHLLCLRAITNGVIKDPNFRVAVYRNLANAYWAIGDPDQAIGTYKAALSILEDLNDYGRQAAIYWGLATAYQAVHDWARAKLYTTRALHLYEAEDNRVAAATMSINLAEYLIADKQHPEAADMLKRAETFLQGVHDEVLLGNLYYDCAELARQQGQLENADQHISKSIELLEKVIQRVPEESPAEAEAELEESKGRPSQASPPLRELVGERESSRAWSSKVRTYAEALHIAALIEENKGNDTRADGLFQQALAWARRTGYEETVYTINLSYGGLLKSRGDFERAVEYLQAAAESRGQHLRYRGERVFG